MGGTIHLNANNAIQILSNANDYHNLIISGTNQYGIDYKGIGNSIKLFGSLRYLAAIFDKGQALTRCMQNMPFIWLERV